MSHRRISARTGLAMLEGAILENLEGVVEPQNAVSIRDIAEDLDIPIYVVNEVLQKLSRIDKNVQRYESGHYRSSRWFLHPERARTRDSDQNQPTAVEPNQSVN